MTDQVNIEVDDAEIGTDSAYDDGASTASTSLSPSVTNYQVENGRRYHAYREGSYIMPNDEPEAERLDIFHHMITLASGLHRAPIGPSPHKVLDLGTGTGIWAIEMGDEYPSAVVIGNDLSPIQPRMVPPNVRFIVDDMTDEWVSDPTYDYIHARYLVGAISDWPKLLRQVYDNLEPGGWAEFQDWDTRLHCIDDTLKPDSELVKWTELGTEAMVKLKREHLPGPKLKQWMSEAGFKDVRSEVVTLPLGPWPKDPKLKELGRWNQLHFTSAVEGLSMALYTRELGWKAEEVQVLSAQVRNEMKDPKLHVYYNFHIVYGQK